MATQREDNGHHGAQIPNGVATFHWQAVATSAGLAQAGIDNSRNRFDTGSITHDRSRLRPNTPKQTIVAAVVNYGSQPSAAEGTRLLGGLGPNCQACTLLMGTLEADGEVALRCMASETQSYALKEANTEHFA